MYVAAVLDKLRQMRAEVFIEPDFAHFIKQRLNLPVDEMVVTDKPFQPDVAISMGGDGTFLNTASRIGAGGHLFWASIPGD